MPFNKNHTARLKRVEKELDRAMDSLNKASGELWPAELRPFREQVETAKTNAEQLHKRVSDAIRGVDRDAADEGQTDIEDAKPVDDGSESLSGDVEITEPPPTTPRRRSRGE